ncbi:MAG: Qat anti-phage system TatD family nuclease QatD [Litorimonas sp.]
MMDFHAHLDLFKDPADTIERLDKAGFYVLSVTTTPSAFLGTRRLAKGCRRIRTGLGLHPQVALERQSELGLFDRLLDETNYVGEIGLDGSNGFRDSLSTQQKVFRHILRSCTSKGGKVLSVHSRGASSLTLDMLAEHAESSHAILHWFSGRDRDLERAITDGHWFSVGRPMTTSRKQRERLSMIPRNRILLESDAPFAKFEGKFIHPLDTVEMISFLSKLWSTSEDETVGQLMDNVAHIGRYARRVNTVR